MSLLSHCIYVYQSFTCNHLQLAVDLEYAKLDVLWPLKLLGIKKESIGEETHVKFLLISELALPFFWLKWIGFILITFTIFNYTFKSKSEMVQPLLEVYF